MKITLEMLKEKQVCIKGENWFINNFPKLEASHKKIIKKLEEEKTCTNWIAWLMVYFKLSGVCKEWWGTGNLEHKCHYRKGVLHGRYKVWYANGEFCNEIKYKKGVRIK